MLGRFAQLTEVANVKATLSIWFYVLFCGGPVDGAALEMISDGMNER